MSNGQTNSGRGPQLRFIYAGPGSTIDPATGACTYSNVPIPTSAGSGEVTILACGAGGGGSAGDSSGGSQLAGYGGGGGAGAIPQLSPQIGVTGGTDTVTVTLNLGGKGGQPNGNAGSPGRPTTIVFSNSPKTYVFEGAPGAPHCKFGGGAATRPSMSDSQAHMLFMGSSAGGRNAMGGSPGFAGQGATYPGGVGPGGAEGRYSFPGANPNSHYGGCGSGGGGGFGPGSQGGCWRS